MNMSEAAFGIYRRVVQAAPDTAAIERQSHNAQRERDNIHASPARRHHHHAEAAISDVQDILRNSIGDRVTVQANENGDLFAEIAASQIDLVAGAGFEPATFGL